RWRAPSLACAETISAGCLVPLAKLAANHRNGAPSPYAANQECPHSGRVAFLLRAQQRHHVALHPAPEQAREAREGTAERREPVFDARRNLGIALAADERIALELAQRLDQHLLGDAVDAAADLR